MVPELNIKYCQQLLDCSNCITDGCMQSERDFVRFMYGVYEAITDSKYKKVIVHSFVMR